SVALGRTAYRFVQEGLTNARKHAPDSAVEVLLDGTAGEDLRITITYPCAGTAGRPAPPGAGMGLVGLGERVALAGGKIEYGGGASGFLLKDTPPRDIIEAVRTVAAGAATLSPTVIRQL